MVKRFYLLIIFLSGLLSRPAVASDSLIVHKLAESDSVPVMNLASFLVDETNQLEWKDVISRSFATRNGLTDHIDSVYGKKRVTLWLRFTVNNVMEDSLKLMLVFQRYAYFKELLMIKGTDTTFIKPNYLYTSLSKQERKNVSILLYPGEGVSFLVRIFNPYANLFPKDFLLTNRKAYLNARMHMYHKAYLDDMFKMMFLAVVLFITLHTLVQYFIRRRKEFVFYALYSSSVFFFFLYRLEHSIYYDILFSHFPYIYKLCNNPLSIIIYYTYFRFAREFVDFKTLFPWFYRTIIWTERVLIAALVFDFICNIWLNDFELREIVFTGLRIALLGISFIGIYLLLSSGKRVLYFFGVGSLLLIIGSMLAMIYTFYPEATPIFKNDSIRFMQIGIILELLCFTSGLSYKSHLIEVDKRNVQGQLIRQLEENRRLQEELNLGLETRVKEQTEQILTQQQQLEKEKEQQLTLTFNKKLMEMELQVLKSQLNPHFYFNTLNNLYGLTMIDPKKAPNAILKLSDIMEYVIYDCKNEKVSLKKELKFISSYIELEKLRYDDNSRIQLNLQGDSEGKFISPLLLIQFVENAFKHGMEQRKNNSFMTVNIEVKNNLLFYQSVNTKKEKAYNINGVGLNNVRKRLDILYHNKHRLLINESGDEFKVELQLEL